MKILLEGFNPDAFYLYITPIYGWQSRVHVLRTLDLESFLQRSLVDALRVYPFSRR